MVSLSGCLEWFFSWTLRCYIFVHLCCCICQQSLRPMTAEVSLDMSGRFKFLWWPNWKKRTHVWAIMWVEKNGEKKEPVLQVFLVSRTGWSNQLALTGAQGQKLAESASCCVKMSPTQSRPRKTSVLKSCKWGANAWSRAAMHLGCLWNHISIIEAPILLHGSLEKIRQKAHVQA